MPEFRDDENLELRTLDFGLMGQSGYFAAPTWAGMPVSEEQSITLSALWCGIRVLAEDIASLPCYLYDLDENDHATKDRDNDLYVLLLSEPNPEMTAPVFWENMMLNCIVYGNAFAEIQRKNNGDIFSIFPIHPNFVRVYRDENTGTLAYQDTRNPGGGPAGYGTVIKDASDMIHIPSLSLQGSVGMSLLYVARQCIAYGLALDRFGASVMRNAAKPSGYIQETVAHTGKNASDNLTSSWEKESSKEQAGRTNFLKVGYEYKQLDLATNEQLQYLQLKEQHANEVARFLRLSPIKLMSYGRATWNNATEFNRTHWQDSIRPWVVKIEAELQKKLLKPSEKATKRIRFDPTDLLRADPLTQAQVAEISLGNQPWKSVNEVRREQNLPDMGPEYDVIGKPQPEEPDNTEDETNLDATSNTDNGNPQSVVTQDEQETAGVM